MAIRHCSHPQHFVLKNQYDITSPNVCDVCGANVAGRRGYRCDACDFDIHEACADYFKETVSFFAHPWHTLTLSRMTADCRICDICQEDCRPGLFVYRCIQCGFDVHPLCTLVPQTIRSPLHQEHDLNMVAATGRCSACSELCHVWFYRCGFCSFNLHVWCPSSGVQDAPSSGVQGAPSNVVQRAPSSGVQKSVGSRVAKSLLNSAFRDAVDAVTNGMASTVLEALQEEDDGYDG